MITETCPWCGAQLEDNSEYVHIGIGYQQVTYQKNCPNCGTEGVHRGFYEVAWFNPEGLQFDPITKQIIEGE